MDTAIRRIKKNSKTLLNTIYVASFMGILLIPCFFKGLPILAQENLKIANNAIISPLMHGINIEKNIASQLSIEEQKAEFNRKIRQKYKGGYITDVELGVKHIRLTRYYNKRPVRFNVIEINKQLNPNLEIAPALASDKLARKSTITTIAKRNHSLVAINGTYFKPQTGVPLGTLMINKKIYTGPIYDRVAMGIFDNHYDMARIQLNATLDTKKESIKIDNINQPRMLSTYLIAYTPEWGTIAPPSPKYGKQIVVKDNEITIISPAQQVIPQNGYVIVGPASKMDKLKVGDKVKFNAQTIPNWENVNHIISGGPYLIKNGQTYVDIKEQKLLSVGGRNPRTAIGYTADNNFIIVTVDGREESSIGLTLTELANFMKSIGCYEAMNLDGGGSTVMYVNGRVVNQPAHKGGIALSNALTISKIN
ncbi:MAG: phosphodiester glycosidase family protein [bacterium]|nr:phosphodiester glycosidase family protein [bacterium]